MFKSIIRLCFHERRLQYSEKEQLSAWHQSRPNDRLLEIDVPRSFGISNVTHFENKINACQLLWDPMIDVGVYIRVHCISTEFTPKKHGGEKGVPFRIQIETYSVAEDGEASVILHGAACQIKVFKLKGADRKHKQDRDKVMKQDQVKYQPSYDCTVLTEIPLDLVTSIGSSSLTVNTTPEPETFNEEKKILPDPPALAPIINCPSVSNGVISPSCSVPDLNELNSECCPELVSRWLKKNRFHTSLPNLSNFTASEIYHLTRDDLIQICGLADGIRLYNALHRRRPLARLTLYISASTCNNTFHAVYLSELTVAHLIDKVAPLVFVSNNTYVQAVHLEGPCGIHILVTDEVVMNMKCDSLYIVEVLSGDYAAPCYCGLLLRPYTSTNNTPPR